MVPGRVLHGDSQSVPDKADHSLHTRECVQHAFSHIVVTKQKPMTQQHQYQFTNTIGIRGQPLGLTTSYIWKVGRRKSQTLGCRIQLRQWPPPFCRVLVTSVRHPVQAKVLSGDHNTPSERHNWEGRSQRTAYWLLFNIFPGSKIVPSL